MNTTLNQNSDLNTNPSVVSEITKFVDDSIVTTQDIVATPLNPSIPINPYVTETIVEWLQRPYVVKEVVWSNQAIGKELVAIELPRDYAAIKPIWEKMNRFAYLRGGFKVSIRINGTKFHYGKLIAAWLPLDSVAPKSFVQLSAYPHLIVTPTSNEVFEMDIPFLHPHQALKMGSIDPFEQLGTFVVYILNPLGGLSASTVDISVFVSMIKPELMGYTHTDPGIPSKSSALFPITISSLPSFVAQSGEAQIKNKEHSTDTILERVASYVTSIPTFSFGSVSTNLRSLASIANHFGYCKPLSPAPIQPVVQRFGNIVHSHGLDVSQALTMRPDAKVGQLSDLIAIQDDSLEVARVVSRPAVIGIYNWTSTIRPGGRIAYFPVHPILVPTESEGNYTRVYHSPLSYVANAASLWRGSIRLCVQVTASAFHSGRLRIGWLPNRILQESTVLTDEDYATNISTILDLQTENVAYITIPYLKTTMWSTTNRTTTASNGYFFISVLNSLTSSEFPVPPIYINVWVSGGPDFQIAQPRPVSQLYVAPPAAEVLADKPKLIAQSGTCVIQNASYDSMIPATGFVDDQICVSETITSLYDLIKRPSLSLIGTTAIVDRTNVLTFYPVQISPTNVVSGRAATYLDYFQRMFIGGRGSVSVKVFADLCSYAEAHIESTPEARSNDSTSPVVGIVTFQSYDYGASIYPNPSVQPIEFTIPYNSTAIFLRSMGSSIVASDSYNVGRVYLHYPQNESGGKVYRAFKSAGDDFQFVYQIGPPETRELTTSIFL
jgi:hypothetical protein